MKYSHETWSLELPSGWKTEQTDHCSLFYDPEGPGALQISCFFKSDGFIEQQDLLDFAETDLESVEPIQTQRLSGIYHEYHDTDEGFLDRQWWLAAADEIIFITYSCDTANAEQEIEQIRQIIDSISLITS